MPENTQPPVPARDDLEHDVDAAIAACGGSLRETIKSLLIANSFLVSELEHIAAATSNGFARGKLRRRAKGL